LPVIVAPESWPVNTPDAKFAVVPVTVVPVTEEKLAVPPVSVDIVAPLPLSV
jgi:hypothetical protein